MIEKIARAIAEQDGKRERKPTGVTLTEADLDQISEALSGGWGDGE